MPLLPQCVNRKPIAPKYYCKKQHLKKYIDNLRHGLSFYGGSCYTIPFPLSPFAARAI